MKRITVIICLLAVYIQSCLAQDFQYKAEIKPLPADSFYKIQLDPEIVGKLKADFSDIRIYNSRNKEIPYLLDRNIAVQTKKYFREYLVISKTSLNKVGTTLILRNPGKNKINNISLVIKNTNVTKKASLSGSSDAQHWYALQDNYVLQSVFNSTETSEVKVLNFPLSDYEYYRLEINDSASAPLNILAAGFYDFNAENGKYTSISGLKYKQTDSAQVKRSYLKFAAKYPVVIDKLEFKIDSPGFYLRNATVFIKETVYGRSVKRQEIVTPVKEFQLRSDTKNSILMDSFRAKEFYLEIENEDNLPLHIQQVNGFQLNTYLVANLKKDQTYTLWFGSEKVGLPTYDLQYFKDKIPIGISVIKPSFISKTKLSENDGNKLNSFFKDNTLVWVVLILVIALLGFMSYQMLKETPPNN